MEQIREQLSRLSELDNDALSALSDLIFSEFETADSEEVSPEVVEKMTELANAHDAIANEREAREAQVKELSDMKDAAVQRLRGDEAETEATVTEDDEVEEELPEEDEEETDPTVASVEETAVSTDEAAEASTEEVEAPVEAEAETFSAETETAETAEDANAELANEETVETPEVETELATEANAEEAGVEETELNSREDLEAEMSASTKDQGPTIQAPETHRPTTEVTERAVARATTTITAGGDIRGVSAGSTLPSMDEVSKAMTQRIQDISRSTGGDGETFSVATINIEYPEDRHLTGNTNSDADKIAAVASPQAVVAAGGFCAPVEVSYDIYGFGTTARPVKDSLASFSADRGGILYTTSPVLGDLSDAVSLWTLQDDLDAATDGAPNPVKPCLRVNCGEEVKVVTDAIPLCLTFGNLQTRAFPEMVARNNELALIEHARYAETRLLTRIGALSTNVSAAQTLGAARDFFVQVDQAAAAYRSRHRLDPAESLRVIVPHWLKNMVRADITKSLPAGDDTDRFAIADNIVDAWFRARHINVTWHLDGEAGQIFGAQNAGTLNAFPSTVVWYLFSEGTFLFLDGGTLDLGLVRDSSLNSTNDYKMFVETFEAVAKVGVESLRIASAVKVNGASAGTVVPA